MNYEWFRVISVSIGNFYGDGQKPIIRRLPPNFNPIGITGSVIGGQKIAPCGIGIAIEYRICGSPQFVIVSGGICIFLPVYDVACGIIGPGPGFSQLLVVLPDQLVGAGVVPGRSLRSLPGNQISSLSPKI